ncbi:hypothetical protein [Lacihabitans soyangensis]|uniref:Uncharacterized protein n=1 Tax=Lacihabitans soyangensis TaxID=869394 RepID=A0AAE3KTS9_9BACT|nr:hypothetical protein [Lacihabitans soyangensis]MCP9764094.1 hypothetical protein [Lacihabitans soyangensis]
MKFGNINIKNSTVNFNENNFDVNSKVITEFISQVKDIGVDKVKSIKNHIEDIENNESLEVKEHRKNSLKEFLISNGIAISQSLTASAIFELLKFLYSN